MSGGSLSCVLYFEFRKQRITERGDNILGETFASIFIKQNLERSKQHHAPTDIEEAFYEQLVLT